MSKKCFVGRVFSFLGLFLGVLCVNMASAQVLVIAPHPDDEVLGAAERMQFEKARGKDVFVLFLTDGEALKDEDRFTNEAYGRVRRQESKNAMQMMGIPPEKTFFLGFPDGKLSELSDEILFSSFTESGHTNADTYRPHTPFTRPDLEYLIEEIINKTGSTEVYYTSPEDNHPDHAVTGEIMRYIAQNLGLLGWEYLIHKETPRQRWRAHDPYPKLDYIRSFSSQFHTPYYQYYLESFAYFPETFVPFMTMN